MSKSMPVEFESYLYCAMGVALVYGMGPGTVVGLVGCPIYGYKILADKIKLIREEHLLSNSQAAANIEITERIIRIRVEMDHHIKIARTLALGMIPLVGGYLVLNRI